MLRFYDKNNVVTDELNNPSVLCGKPGCLGEPWLGYCKEASMASPDYEDELSYQLSQQLDSNSTLLEEHSSSTSPATSSTLPSASISLSSFAVKPALYPALLFQSSSICSTEYAGVVEFICDVYVVLVIKYLSILKCYSYLLGNG